MKGFRTKKVNAKYYRKHKTYVVEIAIKNKLTMTCKTVSKEEADKEWAYLRGKYFA